MNNDELLRKSVDWLELESKKNKSRPQQFTPREVAEAVGGYTPAMGKVADQIVTELRMRGCKCSYLKKNDKRFFRLL